MHQGGGREEFVGRNGTATGPEKCGNVANMGEPLAKFWTPGPGDVRHRSTPPPPSYPPRLPSSSPPLAYGSQPRPSPPPHTPGFQPGEWLPQGEGGQQARAEPVTQPAPTTGLAALGLTESAVHALAEALQGVVANGVAAALPSPALSGPTGKVATLSLLHLRFVCGVAADVDLPPIWESVVRGQDKMDGLATLNQT